MGWADEQIEKLRKGETVQFRPRGDSMRPQIKNGQLVTVVPVKEPLKVGDVVLCAVYKSQYLHFIKDIVGDRIEIQNSKGRSSGWTSKMFVYGVCVKVEK